MLSPVSPGRRRARRLRFAACLLPLLLTPNGEAGNLGCLGGDCSGPGYAVYRAAEPGNEEWKAACGDWKTDFVVLNDDGWQEREQEYRRHCPNGEVVYAESQAVSRRLDTDFLALFDGVIARARSEGRKVLFHCRLGTHRTGRLAAYYGLRFEGWTVARALEDFEEHVSRRTRLFAFVTNRRVRRQIRGIAAFLRDPATCPSDLDGDCIVVTSPATPKSPAVLAAEKRLRPE